ncbi:hypothetical protein BDZ91DRAFT_797533 [Kalaharituber pfeilii]|nr:hypothetical protein BDZ91DRAFT_797533 [Kalaharituber pfeilii]
MPHQFGGKNAVAFPSDKETLLTSTYTILVTGVFMAWWIMIAAAIPIMVPRRLRHNKAIRLVAAWEITEPFHAMYLMVGFCWQVLTDGLGWRGGCSREPKRAEEQEGPIDISDVGERSEDLDHRSSSEQSGGNFHHTTSDLLIGVIVLCVAAFVLASGLAAGVLLPGTLVIGHVAPVNASALFIPFYHWNLVSPSSDASPISSHILKFGEQLVGRIPLFGHFTVASGMVKEALEESVKFQKFDTPNGQQEEVGNGVTYGFRLHGWELGLQHLSDLSVQVSGRCRFRSQWYVGMLNASSCDANRCDGIDVYNFFPGREWEKTVNLSLSAFGESDRQLHCEFGPLVDQSQRRREVIELACVPFRLNMTWGPSVDPWYRIDNTAGGSAPGRPPLHCVEKMIWRYKGKIIRSPLPKLQIDGMRPMMIRDSEPVCEVKIPDGILILLTGLFYKPLLFNYLGLMLQAGIGQSLLLSPLRANATVYDDLKQWVQSAYWIGRNGIRYAAFTTDHPMFHENFRPYNMLLDQEGQLMPGVSDFVLPSGKVSTLRLETLVAVPVVVGTSWIVVLIMLHWKRRSKKHAKGRDANKDLDNKKKLDVINMPGGRIDTRGQSSNGMM